MLRECGYHSEGKACLTPRDCILWKTNREGGWGGFPWTWESPANCLWYASILPSSSLRLLNGAIWRAFLFIYLCFLASLCLHCCTWAFSSCGEQGLLSSLRSDGFSWPWLLWLRSTSSRVRSSVVATHWLCCTMACGIFLDQGSNPLPLHGQADCSPLDYQGNP